MLLAGVAGLVENLVGLMAGEALIPEMDGQAGELAELLGKGLTLQSLRADLSGKLEWVADDDTRDAEAPTQPGKRTQVFAAVRASVKGEHRLCGKTQFIRDGHADAAGADVESEIAKTGVGVHGAIPWIRLRTSIQLMASSPILRKAGFGPIQSIERERKRIRAMV